MTTEKPFAPSCERNQAVILKTMQPFIRSDDKQLLEVGSGTGQHAVFLATHLPQLNWQTSDLVANHAGIRMWLDESKLSNVLPPLPYEIGQDNWPAPADVVFTANTLHIMAEALVSRLIQDLGANLISGNRVIIYGPFKYQKQFTSTSNADFDLWLKQQDPVSGIRDFEL